jgi:hypothetical protein
LNYIQNRVCDHATSSLDLTLFLIEQYPAAVNYPSKQKFLPIHYESKSRCRAEILAKLTAIYPQSVSSLTKEGNLPLHEALCSQSGPSIEGILLLMDKYPAALTMKESFRKYLPIQLECRGNLVDQ